MATYVPPKKNTAYIFYAALVSQANTKIMKTSPTLASGDFKVSIDGGALANLATLPTNTPSGAMVKFSLSSSEMNGDNITVVCTDAAGAEWCDLVINIQTAARQINDLAYPATSGRSMVVDASGLVDANTVKVGPTGSGTAQTARDIGSSVLLSAGTGTGQLDFTSGVVKANLVSILGTALTETAGQIAAGFKKLFDVASPVFTLLSINQTGDAYARLGAPAGASVSADVAAVKAVLPSALVSGRIDASVGAMAANVLTATAINADAITAAKIADGAIDAATFAAGAINAAAIAADAITDAKVAADVTIASVTGAVGSVTGNVGGNVTGSVGSVVGLTASNLDATVSSRLASGSYTAPDNTSITAIKAKTDNLPAAPAAVGDIPTANQNADALLDQAAGVETNRTLRQAFRLMLAALVGKASGMATTTATFRDTNDSKDRIVATVDADGNRSAVTLDAS